ncbi:MAG TPA: TRAP transporter small permease subunit [Dehalococcoidia bacterium]|nr:TRAP transporter small permease subunit [Dehalococcoidia bacterium]
MNVLQRLVAVVDRVSGFVGRVASWVILAMILVVCYNVAMRYVFNSPTAWSFDMNYMLGGSMMALGQALVHRDNGHVRIDVISNRFPERSRLILEIVFTVILFIPVFFMVSQVYWSDFIHAVQIGETMQQSAWYPLAWPFKLMLALGFSFFLIQGLANLVKYIARLAMGSRSPW